MYEWYDQLRRDLRLAGRRAVRHSTFTGIVIACIALGIGATAGAYSVLHPVLLRPLVFEDPDELVQIGGFSVERTDPDERYFIAWNSVDALRRNRQVLEGVAGFYQHDFDVLDGETTERVPGAETLPGSFDVLGIRPVLGRTLREEDVREGRRVVLISESFWARRYGQDPQVLGRSITLGDVPHEIVGVMPDGLRFTARADVWPVHQPDDYTPREQLGLGGFLAIARLPAGRDAGAAQVDLDALARTLREAEPSFHATSGFDAKPLQEFLVGDFRRPLWALFASALFVLLVAAANVANLLMARAQGDAWERGLRTALGAQCRRLAHQSLVENLLLSVLGAAAGVGLGAVAVRGLLAVTPPIGPAFDDVGLSTPVVLVSLVVACVFAGVMTIPPIVRCHAALGVLRGSRDGHGRRERRTQALFVVGQVALSFVLLVGAGLMFRSVGNLSDLDLGFDTERLVTLRVSAPPSSAGTVEGRAGFTVEVLQRIRAIPGVDAAGAVSWVPFSDSDVGFVYSVEDFPPGEDSGDQTLASGRIIGPGYFAAMGIPILAGRDLTEGDVMDAPRVAIVSRAFQERYWPGESALGKRIKRGAYIMDRPWLEIVGVVGDVRSGTLSDAIKPALFYAQAQSEGAFLGQMAYPVRSRLAPEALVGAVRAAVGEVSASATVYGAATGDDISDQALGRARFNGLVIGAFAAIGLLLAAAGVFGVTAYGVGRRTREFGLRAALGAGPGEIRGLVLRSSVGVAAAGIALGFLVAVAVVDGMSALLFGVEPRDPATWITVAAVLATSVILASYGPARRATRISPTVALRDG